MGHEHYKKDVRHLEMIDVYRVVELFDVPAGPIDHAVKKLLCAGLRGHKDLSQDIQDAIDSLQRWQEMRTEDDFVRMSPQAEARIYGNTRSMPPSAWDEGEKRMENIARNGGNGEHYIDPHG